MPSYYNSTAQTKAEIMASHTEKYAHGGRVGFKAGTDKDWIQKATKNMRKDKPCTGKKFGSKTCPPGTRRYNLAKTFRAMNKKSA
jgi:hypothetical protein